MLLLDNFTFEDSEVVRGVADLMQVSPFRSICSRLVFCFVLSLPPSFVPCAVLFKRFGSGPTPGVL